MRSPATLGITSLLTLLTLATACTDDGGGNDEATGSTSESGSGTSESDSSSSTAAETGSETSAGETTDTNTGTGDTTTDTTSETTGFGSCAEIEAAYDSEVSLTQCSGDADCKIVNGHCGVGLGGCYYAVNVEVSETLLDQLADAYVAGNCTMGVCDCPPSPASAVCLEGTCVGQG